MGEEGRTHSGSSLLAEAAELDQLAVQLAFAGEFEHDEHALLVVKIPKHAQDVGMSVW